MKNLFFFVSTLVLVMSSAHADIAVKDDTGQVVQLKAPAKRIVSLAPHLTENLFSAGAGAQMVGAVEYSDWPEAAKKIPRVGGYSRLNLEAIVAQRPDLIVAWQSGNSPAHIAKLKALGIPVYIGQPDKIGDVATEIEVLGQLAGSSAQAKAAAEAFRKRQQELSSRYQNRPKVRTFYQIWNRPLMTVNGQHLISDVMRMCGAENVFADLNQLAPHITEEAVIAANPEAIVASGMGDSRPEWLDGWRKWKQMSATSRDNLFFIQPELMQRHTTRILDGAERLCAHMETARSHRSKGQ